MPPLSLIDDNYFLWAFRYLSIFNLFFYLFSKNFAYTHALKCFTCDGTCFFDQQCNCQTGVCEGDYCFVEKTKMGTSVYIQKGCGRGGQPVNGYQCIDHKVKSGVTCSCDDGDFCNSDAARDQLSSTFLDMLQVPNFSRNITCHSCTSDYAGDVCKRKCTGDYCTLYKSFGGAGPFVGSKVGCGSKNSFIHLTYHSGGFDMLYSGRHIFDDGSACTSYLAGSHLRIQECVCDGSLCNHKSLADNSLTVVRPPPSTGALASPQVFGQATDGALLRCYSCIQTSNEHLVHSSACRSEMCLGQFCLLILESSSQQQGVWGAGLADPGARSSSAGSSTSDVSSTSLAAGVNAFYRRTAGCLNSSRPDFVVKGCTQKWTMKKWEKIECVCDRDLCNVDAMTARSSLNWRIMTTEWTIAKTVTICALLRFATLSCCLL